MGKPVFLVCIAILVSICRANAQPSANTIWEQIASESGNFEAVEAFTGTQFFAATTSGEIYRYFDGLSGGRSLLVSTGLTVKDMTRKGIFLLLATLEISNTVRYTIGGAPSASVAGEANASGIWATPSSGPHFVSGVTNGLGQPSFSSYSNNTLNYTFENPLVEFSSPAKGAWSELLQAQAVPDADSPGNPGKVVILTIDGDIISTIGSVTSPVAVTIGPNGEAFVVESDRVKIFDPVLDASNQLVGYDEANAQTLGLGQINSAKDVVWLSNGDLIVVEATELTLWRETTVLPAERLYFEVIERDNLPLARWGIVNEIDVEGYEFRLRNGGVIGRSPAQGEGNFELYLDELPPGTHYIQQAIINQDGSEDYSSWVSYKVEWGTETRVFPNPAPVGNEITITGLSVESTIVNSLGQTVLQLPNASPNDEVRITLNPGFYLLQVPGNNTPQRIIVR